VGAAALPADRVLRRAGAARARRHRRPDRGPLRRRRGAALVGRVGGPRRSAHRGHHHCRHAGWSGSASTGSTAAGGAEWSCGTARRRSAARPTATSPAPEASARNEPQIDGAKGDRQSPRNARPAPAAGRATHGVCTLQLSSIIRVATLHETRSVSPACRLLLTEASQLSCAANRPDERQPRHGREPARPVEVASATDGASMPTMSLFIRDRLAKLEIHGILQRLEARTRPRRPADGSWNRHARNG
jgi:hypothetical protein